MTVTATAFRGAFPAFADTVKFTDTQINFWLALAAKLHNSERWGDLLDFGVQLWVAHSIALDTQANRTGAQLGAIVGNVTSMSADGISWSRDTNTAMDPSAGHWNLTAWGLRWRDLSRMVGAGPVQVGSPDLYDAYLSSGGWVGPWPFPGEQPM